MHPESATTQHRWLSKFVGQWAYESSCGYGPEGGKSVGTESVRMMGELWLVGDGHGTLPDGAPMGYHFIIGFDPSKRRFVGTWTGSVMSHMFVYEGVLDPTGTVLPLECTGPNPMQPGTMATYRDIMEMSAAGERSMRSEAKGPDGNWVQFMTCSFRRV